MLKSRAKKKSRFTMLVFMAASSLAMGQAVCAQDSDVQHLKRLSLAQSFVEKIKSRLNQANRFLEKSESSYQENILPDGEILLLQPVLERKDRVDGVVLAQVQGQKILLSLTDFSDVLGVAIDVEAENGLAQGWYLKEDKPFMLDVKANKVTTDNGEFDASNMMFVDGDDIFVNAKAMAQWLGMEIKLNISTQEMQIISDIPFPIIEHKNRRKKQKSMHVVEKPKLPLRKEGYKSHAVPTIDVATRSTYRRDGDDAKGVSAHSASIKAVGDLAGGTLATRSRLNNRDQLSSATVNYKRESSEPELLGPLKARRAEIGDVILPTTPFGGGGGQEIGVRVTNADSLRSFSFPQTQISGNATPGWDVELYRNGQLLDLIEIPEDGFYRFKDIDLFQTDNNFKLLFYGPQGEVREEDLYIPIDAGTLSRGGGVYDISVSAKEKTTYSANKIDDEDTGSPKIVALYERPITDGVTGTVSVRSEENDGVRNTVGSASVSTVLSEVLVNAGVALDEDSDIAADVTARHDFGFHQASAKLKWRGEGFDEKGADSGLEDDKGTFNAGLSINGPIAQELVRRMRYAASSDYTANTEGDYTLKSRGSLSAGVGPLSLNTILRHETSSTQDEDELKATLNMATGYGGNLVRVSSNYEIKPDKELTSVDASIRRDITNDMELKLGISRAPQQKLTEYEAQLDWQAGFARISPSIRYNSESDFFAGLSTRFGVMKDPVTGKFKSYDRNVTNVGLTSAFVFLDKEGDGQFNGDDEPLEGVIVRAPQNGRRQQTDENGIALFKRMTAQKVTDVYLDEQALHDPTWVSGFEGVSIIPREGYITQIDFPVHMSGEIDGTLYAYNKGQAKDNGRPLKNVRIILYNAEGEVEKIAATDATGFYYMTQVPPGRYLLFVHDRDAEDGGFMRPQPQQIEIGYDGTIMYENNIFVEQGQDDVPSQFLADIEDFRARHPHIDFSGKNYDMVLNLGEFNSRLLMSVIWYKLRTRYAHMLAGAELFVPPAESYADEKTGKHTLRVGIKEKSIDDAYKRCHALIARAQYCKVEIFPSYMKQAQLDVDKEETAEIIQ